MALHHLAPTCPALHPSLLSGQVNILTLFTNTETTASFSLFTPAFKTLFVLILWPLDTSTAHLRVQTLPFLLFDLT